MNDNLSKFPLYRFQKEAVEFLRATKTAILGLEPGLGKSLTAIAAVHSQPDIRRTLILCPAILKTQWREEILKWLPNASITVISGKPQQRLKQWQLEAPNATYVVANYELLLRDTQQFFSLPFDAIVADEATRVANRRGKQAQWLYKLPSTHRYALTGTPLNNSPVDIFGIFKFINPDYLGYWTPFINRYAVLNQWFQPDYYQNLDELAERIAPYLFRRTVRQVMPDLPPVIEADRVVEFSPREQQLYTKLKQELVRELHDEGILDKLEHPTTLHNALVKLTRLRQAADSFELLGSHTSSSKLEALSELLLELAGQQVLIFTEFATMARLIAGYTGAEVIDGKTPTVERQELVKKYQDGTINTLVTTKAGQYGLNLPSDAIIHTDQPWSLAALEQRIGRSGGFRRTKTLMVYHLLVKSSVDFYIRRTLRAKQKISDRVLGSDVSAMLEE